jgi:glycerophosphoryl diester phosphodiesterase
MQKITLILLSCSTLVGLAVACNSDNDSAGGSAGAAGHSGSAGKAGAGGSVAGEAGESSAGTTTGGGSAGALEIGGEGGASAAGEGGTAGESALPLPTLDGALPLVIGHRGLPGLFPEETGPSYEGAADAGADSLEEDLTLSKDCVLVARHNPWMHDNTNINDVVAGKTILSAAIVTDIISRKRTVPGVMVPVLYDYARYGGPPAYLSDLTDPTMPKSVLKSLVVDGEDHTNDWSVTDFTVAELKAWFGGTTFDAAAQRPMDLNGLYPILTMQEIINIAKAKSARTGRTISVYPEAKNPYWGNAQALANGCPGTRPLEDAIVKLIKDNGLNTKAAPIFVQSFDPASLTYMRSIGLQTKAVQLIDAWDVDYTTGDMIYHVDSGAYTDNTAGTFIDGRPYSWTVAGDHRYFSDLITPAGLADVATYADGIGPWKPQVLRHSVVPVKANATRADVNTLTSTGLVANAHRAGLFVHTYTFRNEPNYLAGIFNGSPSAEYLPYFKEGVDGVFTDFTNTAVPARAAFLKEFGH